MVRNRRLSHREVSFQFAHVHLTLSQQHQDTLARLIGHRFYEIIEVTARHLAHRQSLNNRAMPGSRVFHDLKRLPLICVMPAPGTWIITFQPPSSSPRALPLR